MATYTLDTAGEVCPFPLVEAKQAMVELASGDELVIDFDCTQATEAIPACQLTAAEVGAVAGVDLDLGAGLEEQRHLDLGAGLERGRLGAAGGAVALQARLGVRDLEDDRRGQLDVQHGAVVGATIASWFSSMYLAASPTPRSDTVDLVVGVGVHEDEVVPSL
jgi:TusA-related sulfurtransferase